jgi:cytochrome P450
VKHLTAIAERVLARHAGTTAQAPSGCPYTLLVSLVKNGEEKLEHQLVIDQIRTMLVSAPENPGNTLAWALCRLEEHAEIRARVLGELDEVLGGRDPVYEDLARLEYTRRFLEEVLRLYPGAWILDRWSVADDELLGFRVPGQRMIIQCPYFVHRDPELWPDPERFDPDRFLPEAVAARPAHHYIPFGMGPRNCIGSRLAMLEIQLLLPMLLSRYRFEIASKRPVETNALVTLRPKELKFRISETSPSSRRRA